MRTPVKAENNSLDENYIDWRRFPDERLGVTLQTRTARLRVQSVRSATTRRAGALTLASLDTLEREFDNA